MLFAIICRDRPGGAGLRAELRPKHLEWAKAYAANIKLAGPFLSEDGQTMIGSLFLAEFPDRAAAQAFNMDDPYTLGGLFASVEIVPWRRTLGAALD
jgi:uncharacterized protein YciI